MANPIYKKASKKKKHAVELGIGLGLVLPICAAAIIVPSVLVTQGYPTDNNFKLIIVSGENVGEVFPSEIELTPVENDKVYAVKGVYNDEDDEIKEINIESTNPNKFVCRANKSKRNATNLKASKNWAIEVLATNDAEAYDYATFILNIVDASDRQLKVIVNVWIGPSLITDNSITYNDGTEYKLIGELSPSKFLTNQQQTFQTDKGLLVIKQEDWIKVQQVNIAALDRSTSIPDGFLANLDNLTSVNLTGLANIKTIGKNFLSNCPQLPLLDLTMIQSLTSIGNNFLSNNTSLSELHLTEKNVTSIGDCFLSGCSGLTNTSVDFSKFTILDTIGTNFLDSCTSLTELDLSKLTKLNNIGSGFFNECSLLNIIKLPRGTTIPANFNGWGNNVGQENGTTFIELNCGEDDAHGYVRRDNYLSSSWSNSTVKDENVAWWTPYRAP